jgi:hypothetical protein
MEATLRRGANVTSNSPHNVFLDFLVNGGFILFGLYAALVLVTLFVSMKVIRLSKTYSPTYASIFGVWMGYLAQSFISVNQLGLAVWGWILMGALLGMNSQGSLDQQDTGNSNSKKRIKVDSSSSPAVIIVGFLGILLGMVLSIWPIKNSIDYASSLRSGDADRLMSNALQVPIQAERLFDISVIFSNNNLEAQSVELLRKAIILYPNKFEIWQALSVMTTATPAEKTQALAQMKRLDPYNPDLK